VGWLQTPVSALARIYGTNSTASPWH